MRILTFLIYCLTIFLGSFLLFQIQPIFARIILPWFGGTPNVWTTCLVFYQVFLFLGYSYSFIAQNFLSLKKQSVVHAVLLILSFVTLGIYPEQQGAIQSTSETIAILTLLFLHIGFPYFLISTCSPLVQSWFALSFKGKKVYRLYALSNFASFLALFSYPFVIEPMLSISQQTFIWEYGYQLFIMCYFLLCLLLFFSNFQEAQKEISFSVPKSLRISFLQVVILSSLGVVLLLAVTNFVCYDIAVIPFLWILPLGLYLLTFVLCFSDYNLYWRKTYTLLSILSILIFAEGSLTSPDVHIAVTISFAMLALFSMCMLLHGEITRKQPELKFLTLFYLCMSLGGALGGIFVGIIAPRIFNSYFELNLAFAALLFMVFWLYKDEQLFAHSGARSKRFKTYYLIFCFGFLISVSVKTYLENSRSVDQIRNFYGVLKVRESYDGAPRLTQQHGRITHGSELLSAREQNIFQPTAYYGYKSGAGLSIMHAQQKGPVKVGVVGMGVATLAGYGRKEDNFLLYEINADVIRQAKQYFNFLKNSGADLEIFEGDARIVLEKQNKNNFDVLILDAFSSDAIPVHLLTKEAFAVYLRHLNSDGLIAVHVTNRHLDLLPVLKQIALHIDFNLLPVKSSEDLSRGIAAADWVVLYRGKKLLDNREFLIQNKLSNLQDIKDIRLWTDDYSNLFQILK